MRWVVKMDDLVLSSFNERETESKGQANRVGRLERRL